MDPNVAVLAPFPSQETRAIRVVIIDPREERRAITDRLIQRCAALAVVGLAGSLGEAESLIRAEQADLAVLEIQMPVDHGIAIVGLLRRQFPDLRIAVCSFHGDAATRVAALEQGADRYLTKPLQIDELLVAARYDRGHTVSAAD